MKRVPCLSCGVVLSNVGQDAVSIDVEKFGGGIRRTQYRVAVKGTCPACGTNLSGYSYEKGAIIDE